MENNPLVSVVLNFYNSERFLREAIDSVLAQTYTNWELLLVDDGSTDESTNIALNYSRQHPSHIRYLEHENHINRGVALSRNFGIADAKGELIAILDGDDAWFPQKLAEQVAVLQKYPEATMVFGNRLYWYSWAENTESTDSVSQLGFAPNTPMQPPSLIIEIFVKGTAASPIPSDLLFRAGMARRVSGFEEKITGMYEDQPFLTKVFLNEVVVASDACWCKYRLRPDSVGFATRRSGKWEEQWVCFLNWFEDYLMQRERQPREVWRTVQNRLFPYRHPLLNKLLQPARRLVKAMQ